jgi:hypothetical protein
MNFSFSFSFFLGFSCNENKNRYLIAAEKFVKENPVATKINYLKKISLIKNFLYRFLDFLLILGVLSKFEFKDFGLGIFGFL